MALFQPTLIIPDVRSGLGSGVIDVTEDMVISWRINGQSALQSYSITIYTNNVASLQLYTTGQITTNCPAYGTSSDGEPQIFSHTIPAADLASALMYNGYEYKFIIKQWWGASDSESVTQSSASVFMTKAAPSLSIDAIGTSGVINTRYYTFTGTYTQAQGDILNWFRWRVAYANDVEHPLFDSGNITGTMDLSCYYDGFFPDSYYVVRLTAQTESGVDADTGWVNFSCSYSTQTSTNSVTAGCVGGTDAVLVEWDGIKHVEADVTGPYEVTDGVLTLPTGSSITWPKTGTLGYTGAWSVVLSAHRLKDVSGPILTIECESNLTITAYATNSYDLRLDVDVNGTVTTYSGFNPNGINPPSTANEYDLTVAIWPTRCFITAASATPYGIYQNLSSYTQTKIKRITVTGPITCYGVEVVNGTMPQWTMTPLINNYYTIGMTSEGVPGGAPVEDYMIANFKSSSGNPTDAAEPYLGAYVVDRYSLYRLQNETKEFVKIATTDAFTTKVYDYGAKSQQGPYTYYLFPEDATKYNVAPLVSGAVMPCWWNWTLIECEETDNKHIFKALSAYRFRLNVESGAVSNNNQPSIFANFTPYPKVTLAPHNYKSGTLYGLIGAVDGSTGQPRYTDTIEWREALYALSVSQRPLFLKNRKGDLLRIRISAPIVMTTGDNTREQTQTISLPWVEVGSTEGVSLYSVSYAGVQQEEGAYTPQNWQDTSDATAEPAELRVGKTGYNADGKIVGTAKVEIDKDTLILPDGMED